MKKIVRWKEGQMRPSFLRWAQFCVHWQERHDFLNYFHFFLDFFAFSRYTIC